MTQGIYDFLRGAPWFGPYSDQELKLLAGFLKVQEYPAGGALYAEGGPGKGCYVIMDGEVEIHKNTPGGGVDQLAAFGPGSIIGLVALIDGKRHSESCTATRPARCLELSREEFDRLFAGQSALACKFLIKVVRVLVRQLRLTNDHLRVIHEQQTRGPAPRAGIIDLLAAAHQTMGQDIALDHVDCVVLDGQGQPVETQGGAPHPS